MSHNTLEKIYVLCCEVCEVRVELGSEKLGGPGKVVEMDESKFGKRKYHEGYLVQGQWAFGDVDLVERGSRKMALVPVEKQNKETLIPLIQKWVAPGPNIVNDCWAAYDSVILKELELCHCTVNHSDSHKDPQTNAQINTIESP